MSLLGFDHVFTSAQPYEFAPGLTLKVIPPVVLALLKMVAFLDDPARRVKDLDDIRGLFSRYEFKSERLFSDPVLNANLPDASLAPAFLLGLDLRSLSENEEIGIVSCFLEAMHQDGPSWIAFVRARGFGDHREEDARAQLDAFALGFNG